MQSFFCCRSLTRWMHSSSYSHSFLLSWVSDTRWVYSLQIFRRGLDFSHVAPELSALDCMVLWVSASIISVSFWKHLQLHSDRCQTVVFVPFLFAFSVSLRVRLIFPKMKAKVQKLRIWTCCTWRQFAACSSPSGCFLFSSTWNVSWTLFAHSCLNAIQCSRLHLWWRLPPTPLSLTRTHTHTYKYTNSRALSPSVSSCQSLSAPPVDMFPRFLSSSTKPLSPSSSFLRLFLAL